MVHTFILNNLFFFRTSQIIKKDETIQVQETIMKDLKTDIGENRQKAANAWKNVMKGPPTAPVCKGRVCERMSCEQSKIIVYICRYLP